jgi:hypothetical protein
MDINGAELECFVFYNRNLKPDDIKTGDIVKIRCAVTITGTGTPRLRLIELNLVPDIEEEWENRKDIVINANKLIVKEMIQVAQLVGVSQDGPHKVTMEIGLDVTSIGYIMQAKEFLEKLDNITQNYEIFNINEE